MPLLPPKQLCCTAIVAKAFFFGVFFCLSQYKETVYLERSRNQKHRQIALLRVRQQSMPGLACVFAQRCRACSELDAAALPADAFIVIPLLVQEPSALSNNDQFVPWGGISS